jgi:hypothetical protein
MAIDCDVAYLAGKPPTAIEGKGKTHARYVHVMNKLVTTMAEGNFITGKLYGD